MSANNAFSLLNEAEGSDTSYRTIHVSYRIRLTPEMAWSETLKEGFAVESENVFFRKVSLFLVGGGGDRREEARNCRREGGPKESQEGQETSKEGRGKGRRLRCYYKRNGFRESDSCCFVMCSPWGCGRGEEGSFGQTKRTHHIRALSLDLQEGSQGHQIKGCRDHRERNRPAKKHEKEGQEVIQKRGLQSTDLG